MCFEYELYKEVDRPSLLKDKVSRKKGQIPDTEKEKIREEPITA